ncbi:MAG: hypothetical protein R3320_14460 [Nitriliruptorales bacterium]|nr:hypothetical protein [Nitriliruptorales bacterium]
MDDTGRLVAVIGALLIVPMIVILLVTGSDDGRTYRQDDTRDPVAVETSSPTPAPRSAATPVTVDVEPTELPPLDGCDGGALLDEAARRTAFQDGLTAEGEGGGASPATETWLATVSDDLSACAGTLGAGRSRLRGAMEDAVTAVDSYREALAAPDDNSVSGAWSDLEDALDQVIDLWADTA